MEYNGRYVDCGVHASISLLSILSQMNPIHTLLCYVFIITPPSMTRLSYQIQQHLFM